MTSTLITEPAAGDISRRRPRRTPGTAPKERRSAGSRIAYVYILPFFLVFAAFSVYPWLDTAWISLHNVRLSTYDQREWVGLANYKDLLTNHFFWNAFRNTLTIGVISAVPQLAIALGIAHLLNHKLRGRTFFRVAILMPYATSLAAATVIFLELYSPQYGLINWFLDLAHLPKVDWQNSKWPAQFAIASIVMWRWTGYNALIFLAGLQAVDQELYAAASVDGAGKWGQFRHITLPGLRPTIIFAIVVSTIGSAQLFGEPLLYHGGLPDGGSAGQYQTLGLLMYQQGWANDRLGLASATAWSMFVIILAAVLVNLVISRRRERKAG